MQIILRVARATMLFTFATVAGAALHAQDQGSPTVQETLTFIADHVHDYYSECSNREYKDPHGYVSGAMKTANVLAIKSIKDQDSSLIFDYRVTTSTSTDGSHEESPQTLKLSLKEIQLASLEVERNEDEAECKRQHEDSNCGGERCLPVPYHFSMSPEYALRIGDGRQDTSMFFIPVQSMDEGERVKKAILHLIELAGGQTKELF